MIYLKNLFLDFSYISAYTAHFKGKIFNYLSTYIISFFCLWIFQQLLSDFPNCDALDGISIVLTYNRIYLVWAHLFPSEDTANRTHTHKPPELITIDLCWLTRCLQRLLQRLSPPDKSIAWGEKSRGPRISLPVWWWWESDAQEINGLSLYLLVLAVARTACDLWRRCVISLWATVKHRQPVALVMSRD